MSNILNLALISASPSIDMPKYVRGNSSGEVLKSICRKNKLMVVTSRDAGRSDGYGMTQFALGRKVPGRNRGFVSYGQVTLRSIGDAEQDYAE